MDCRSWAFDIRLIVAEQPLRPVLEVAESIRGAFGEMARQVA